MSLLKKPDANDIIKLLKYSKDSIKLISINGHKRCYYLV